MRRLHFFLVICLLLVTIPLQVQAQCFPRTDWPTYTVVRGDTLYRIAQRFGISMADLANANCLTNWNRINYGQRLYVPPGGTPTTPVPQPPPATGTVGGTFQAFESGLMLWRSDNSAIYVLDSRGVATRYPAALYGWLPENTNIGTTPTNRIRPVQGFGRLWSNYPDVRSRLGWAVQGEQGASFTTQFDHSLLVTLMPSFGQLIVTPGNTWSYITGNPPPQPQPPTPTPVPPVTPQILAFNASPTTVTVGQTVTLNWTLQGVQGVLIEVNNAVTSVEPEVTLTNLPLNGATSFTVPGEYRGVWFTIYGVNYGANGAVHRVISSSIYVAVNAPITNTTVYAAYQPYDGGFMIWRSDTGDIFVFYNFGAVSTYSSAYYSAYPDNPVTTPVPPGKIRPINGFGRVWGSQPYFQTQLGWAIAPEQGYTMSVESLPDGRTRFSLPNGYTVSFGNGSWTP